MENKLSALHASLSLLTHVSDYDERLQKLEGLRNRLEALASPELVKALSAHNTGMTNSYIPRFFKHFRNIFAKLLKNS